MVVLHEYNAETKQHAAGTMMPSGRLTWGHGATREEAEENLRERVKRWQAMDG